MTTMSEDFRSAQMRGRKCACGAWAWHKVGEEFAFDEPNPARHNLTQYLCTECFLRTMQPSLFVPSRVGVPSAGVLAYIRRRDDAARRQENESA
jgi:hypothetical protein